MFANSMLQHNSFLSAEKWTPTVHATRAKTLSFCSSVMSWRYIQGSLARRLTGFYIVIYSKTNTCLCHKLSACVDLTLEHCRELVSIACLRRRKGIRFYHAGFRVMTDVATAGTCRHVQHKNNHILLLVVAAFLFVSFSLL